MSEPVYRIAVVALLGALCMLGAWCGYKLDRIAWRMPSDAATGRDVYEVDKTLEQIKKELVEINRNTTPEHLRTYALPPSPPRPLVPEVCAGVACDPGRIHYPPGSR